MMHFIFQNLWLYERRENIFDEKVIEKAIEKEILIWKQI